MERDRELDKLKTQSKVTPKELNKTEISYMVGRECKVVVIKLITGLEKTVEDLSETLNKEKENRNEESIRNEELNN